MKTSKNIIVIIIMLFTIVAAILLLFSVFDLINSVETRKAIIKTAEACGIIAVAAFILYGLANSHK